MIQVSKIWQKNWKLFANVGIRGTAAILSFAAQLAIVKITNEQAYGQYIIFITYCSLLYIFSRSGLDIVVLRQTSIAYANKNISHIKSLLKYSLVLVLIFSTIFWLIYVSAKQIPSISGYFNSAVNTPLLYFGVLTMTILAVVLSVLKGMSAILIADALDSLIKPISLITLTVLFIYLGINKNNIILAFITSNIIITIIITTIILLTIASRSYSKKIVRIEKILTIRDCISFIAIGLMTYSFFQLDTLILSMFRDQVVVGAYNMACNFVRLVIFIPMIVISRAQPSIAHAHSNGNTRKVLSITKTSILQSGICALIAAFLLIFFGETILAFVSEKYRSQHTALSILAIAHLFNAFIIIISGVLLMCKQQKIVLASQALGLVICLPLYFITIPLYGTIGASATVATALAATLISMIYLTRNWMRNFKQ